MWLSHINDFWRCNFEWRPVSVDDLGTFLAESQISSPSAAFSLENGLEFLKSTILLISQAYQQ